MTQENETENQTDAKSEGAPETAEVVTGTDDVPQPEESVASGGEANRPQKSRKAAVVLIVLVAFLCGVSAVGLWAWQELESVKAALADVELAAQSDAAKLADEENARRREIVAEVNRGLEKVNARIDGVSKSLTDLNAALAEVNASKPAALLIAELEYLLRLANHRITLERDRDGAVAAVALAQARLSKIDAEGFAPLQAQLARDMAALQAAKGGASHAAIGVLSRLIGDVDKLDSGSERLTPTVESGAATGGTGWRGVLSAISGNLRQFVEIRKAADSAVPALIPDQERLAKYNIRLTLANARAAALRKDTETYILSLQEADRWLGDFFPADSEKVVAMKQSIRGLRAVQLNPELPDLSGSLALIQSLSHTKILMEATKPKTGVGSSSTTESVEQIVPDSVPETGESSAVDVSVPITGATDAETVPPSEQSEDDTPQRPSSQSSELDSQTPSTASASKTAVETASGAEVQSSTAPQIDEAPAPSQEIVTPEVASEGHEQATTDHASPIESGVKAVQEAAQ